MQCTDGWYDQTHTQSSYDICSSFFFLASLVTCGICSYAGDRSRLCKALRFLNARPREEIESISEINLTFHTVIWDLQLREIESISEIKVTFHMFFQD